MKLEKLYERLNPEERFRAAVSAASRKDGDEWDRLNETSPMRELRAQEPSYFARVQKLWLLSLLHISSQRNRWLCGTSSLAVLMCLDEDEEQPHEARAFEDSTDKLAEAAAISFARARGMDSAFDAFTANLSLDPLEVRAAFGMNDVAFVEALSDAASMNADEQKYRAIEDAEQQSWREFLDHFWNRSINEQYSRLERSFGNADSRRKG